MYSSKNIRSSISRQPDDAYWHPNYIDQLLREPHMCKAYIADEPSIPNLWELLQETMRRIEVLNESSDDRGIDRTQTSHCACNRAAFNTTALSGFAAWNCPFDKLRTKGSKTVGHELKLQTGIPGVCFSVLEAATCN